MSTSNDIPRLAITPGEPAGIGADVLIELIQQPLDFLPIAFADPQLLQHRAAQLQKPLTVLDGMPAHDAHHQAGTVWVQPIPLNTTVTPGQLDARNARYVLATLTAATDACLEGSVDALVTGPVQKSIINEAGIAFSGHTEFLAERTHTRQVVMMLATSTLRVALLTTHAPLSAIPAMVTRERLHRVIGILHDSLQHTFGISAPRILVLGLNPHAGEGGHLGREEIDVITPALDELRQQGMQLSGPVPADTAFTPHSLAGHDAVLAMYHDQGLPVLKAQGFGEAINITLGLPIIRTSVDHGTALSLAGTGKADAGSLRCAAMQAAQLVRSRRQSH
ncbi:MAG: 4-hydroxythreonine-4-phosphate dehydrogenase PdxA [Gammaproteobacteria bacterium]|nr:MAG: 4-hydroxythreonine-4-phosphate dehydrogenase PdxA [Gammaproteobacteria bacterium]